MDKKERIIDIQNLKRHKEFYAFKLEMEEFCKELDDLSNVDLESVSRVTLSEEIYGRRYASQKIKDLLSTLGLVDKSKPKIIDKTGE